MALFWWVAIRDETFLLLTTSLFVAPLLLLRSAELTRVGVKWFDDGMFPLRQPNNPSARTEAHLRWLGIGAAIGIAIGLSLGYPAAKLYLVSHEGWGAFVRGMGLGLAISLLAFGIAIAASVAGLGAAGATVGAGLVGAPEAGLGAIAGMGAIAAAAVAAAAAAAAATGAVVVVTTAQAAAALVSFALAVLSPNSRTRGGCCLGNMARNIDFSFCRHGVACARGLSPPTV